MQVFDIIYNKLFLIYYNFYFYSGCVTSAETVLIQDQSIHKLFEKLLAITSKEDDDIVIVCISPQTKASISNILGDGFNPSETFLRIASVLKYMGVHYVFDSSAGGDIALMECREEFLSRY
jgi:iron only hydrogenase large subunit-like protein